MRAQQNTYREPECSSSLPGTAEGKAKTISSTREGQGANTSGLRRTLLVEAGSAQQRQRPVTKRSTRFCTPCAQVQGFPDQELTQDLHAQDRPQGALWSAPIRVLFRHPQLSQGLPAPSCVHSSGSRRAAHRQHPGAHGAPRKLPPVLCALCPSSSSTILRPRAQGQDRGPRSSTEGDPVNTVPSHPVLSWERAEG